MMIWTMFAIVSMLRITGVEIYDKTKCANYTAISKSLKKIKSHIHSVGNVGKDYINYVSHS